MFSLEIPYEYQFKKFTKDSNPNRKLVLIQFVSFAFLVGSTFQSHDT
jgi:hypothetical protein